MRRESKDTWITSLKMKQWITLMTMLISFNIP
jgi:hypothetical protein